MKSKFTFLFLLVGLFTVASPRWAQAQNDSSQKKMIEMVKEFYTRYITTTDRGEIPQMTTLQKQYCTPKLFKKIPELGNKLDQDPFLKAQDSNIKFLNSLVVEGDKNRNGHCIVSYDDGKTIINISVILMDGKYKIDNVW